MRVIRNGLLVLCLSLGAVTPALARVDIDLNFSLFPELVPVPGYPVYYAPQAEANFFFYDGMYWLYQDDEWYASDWYNGPWEYVDPEFVPLYVLRIPVRYYRRPPPYFYDWRPDGPPRWGYRWGDGWQRRHNGWDRWDHRHIPAPAPLPDYQRHYSGDRYPHGEQRREIRDRNYRYRPRDAQVREVREGREVQEGREVREGREHDRQPATRVYEPERRDRDDNDRGNREERRPQQNSERHIQPQGDDRERYARPPQINGTREQRPDRDGPVQQPQLQQPQFQRPPVQRPQREEPRPEQWQQHQEQRPQPEQRQIQPRQQPQQRPQIQEQRPQPQQQRAQPQQQRLQPQEQRAPHNDAARAQGRGNERGNNHEHGPGEERGGDRDRDR